MMHFEIRVIIVYDHLTELFIIINLFQHDHYFESSYGVSYNKSPPHGVPKELIHLKGNVFHKLNLLLISF